MVSLSSALTGCALVTIFSMANSASLESNPITLTGNVIALNDRHPAFGAKLETALPIVTPNANATTTPSRLRSLEESDGDIEKLESQFGRLERAFTKLPTKAEFTPAPWPGNYWPVYQDGINVKWNGPRSQSAAEKYARGFGLDVKQFMNGVSRRSGVLSQRSNRRCRKNTRDCSGLNDGSVCAVRDGETSGYCIPTWFGVCHAWSPAAILEPEPKCPVTKNGITFQPVDIKALITQVYDSADVPTIFTGARYDGPVDAEKDKYGRFVDAAYRDIGPGLFHIAITNLLGLKKTSFVVDVTAGPEVWNQPVRSFEITEQKPYSLEEAARAFYESDTYPFNPNAKKLMYVRNNFRWIVESTQNGPLVSSGAVERYTSGANYEYLLELDDNDRIIGGEWLRDSNSEHPDFLWVPLSQPDTSAATDFGLRYSDVKDLLQASVAGSC